MSVSSPAYSLTTFAPWGRRLHLETADSSEAAASSITREPSSQLNRVVGCSESGTESGRIEQLGESQW